jgi:hypothetical protein
MKTIALRDLHPGAYFRLNGRLGRVKRQDDGGTIIEFADEGTAKIQDGATEVEVIQ